MYKFQIRGCNNLYEFTNNYPEIVSGAVITTAGYITFGISGVFYGVGVTIFDYLLKVVYVILIKFLRILM